MARTRIFFITDVHGSDKCFRKFLNSAKFYGADVLILGGDITGKVIVPILKSPDGIYMATRMGEEVSLTNEGQLAEFRRNVSDSGAYPYLTNQSEFEKLRESEEQKERLFSQLIVERVSEWVTLAEARLGGTGARCFISPGNDDLFEIDRVLSSSGIVTNPEGRVVDLPSGCEMITLGYTNHTPWHSPREVDEAELAKKIDSMTSQVKEMKRAIFNFHVPPIDTPIDQAPKVGDDLKYVSKIGQVEIISAGSSAVRQAIESHQPMLGLHGHIHESRGITTIGRTLCANPGSEYGEGILRGFLADIEGDRIKSYLLTSG